MKMYTGKLIVIALTTGLTLAGCSDSGDSTAGDAAVIDPAASQNNGTAAETMASNNGQTNEEAPGSESEDMLSGQAKNTFTDLDRNSDGFVDQQEADENGPVTQQWDRLDANGDRKLDESEFSKFEPQAADDASASGDSAPTGDVMDDNSDMQKPSLPAESTDPVDKNN